MGLQSRSPGRRRQLEACVDGKSLGHLRHIVNLARQAPGDWSDMGPYDPTQEGDDAYRYQLAYMAYTLSLAQYHHTPAYRELHRDTMARLIEKMMRWEVWGYWELASRGGKVLDPDLTELRDGWIDPVMRQNVMYSGHLLMMVGLYEMLYRDGRFDAEGSLTFEFRPVFRGMGPEDFPYDHGRLVRAIFGEFERNDFIGCECEPNAIFVNCNQFAVLGFIHYDRTHDTDLAARAMPAFRDRWMARSNLFGNDPDADLPIFYRVRQDDFVYEDSEDNNESISAIAWAAVMHAWAREYVEMVYTRGRDQVLRPMPDGTLGVRLAGYLQKHRDYLANPGPHATDPMMLGVHTFGTMALAAAEVGDRETLDGMLAFADTHMRPTWKNGGLYYPRNDDLGSNGYTTARVGNALVAGARLCPKDGLWNMYNHAWGEAELRRPQLCDVRYPEVLVREAAYDDGGATLRLALVPGDGRNDRQSFSVTNLDLSCTHTVTVDDRPPLTIGPNRSETSADDVRTAVDARSSRLRVTMSLPRERRVVVSTAPS